MRPESNPTTQAGSPDPGLLRLRHIAGPDAPHMAIATPRALIGKDLSCDLRLDQPAVSRRHALLERAAPGGGWLLTDLGSRNGTFINGQRLVPHASIPVRHGDDVRFASVIFRVFLRPAPESRMPTLDDSAGPAGQVEVARHGPPSAVHAMLSGLIEASASLHTASSEEMLWSQLLSSALSLTGFQRGAILRQSVGLDSVELRATLDQRRDGDFAFSRTLVQAASEGRAVFLRSQDLQLNSHSISDLHITTAACIPLFLDRAVWGTLYLDSRQDPLPDRAGLPRMQSDDICRALAEIASMALSSLMRREVEERLSSLQRDAELASQAQRLLLPPERGEIGQLRYALRFQAGRVISGDIVGITLLDDRRSAAFLGDVTGKGLGAGLVMATIQGYLTASLLRHKDAVEAIGDLNRHLSERLPPGCFASLWLAVFDAEQRSVQTVDAGHGAAFLIDGTSTALLRSEGGVWLGVDPAATYRSTTTILPARARILVVSDGLLEQPGPGDEQFGLARIAAAIASSSSVNEDVDLLFGSVESYAGTDQFRDDLTVLSLAIDAPRGPSHEGPPDPTGTPPSTR